MRRGPGRALVPGIGGADERGLRELRDGNMVGVAITPIGNRSDGGEIRP